MKIRLLVPMITLATLMLPIAAQAEGTVRGAEEGAAVGGNAAGPLGQGELRTGVVLPEAGVTY